MTDLTERYLAAALKGIPERQRADTERELRSSIADGIEDRIAAGDDATAAERAVLEGLGDPIRLAAGMSGSPLHLIGPELFIEYRRLLTMLLVISMPIVGVVQVGVALAGGDDLVGSLVAGAIGAWTVGVHIFFWVTLTFAAIERFDAMRDARTEIVRASGRWTVDRLPALPPGRVGAGEAVGEVVTMIISIAGLVFLSTVVWFRDDSGDPIFLFNPDVWGAVGPFLIGAYVALAVLHIVIFMAGRWTMALAGAHAILQVAVAAPVVALALAGTLINPAFADAVGWPPLAHGNGVMMLSVAAAVALVTAWEVFDGFRRARQGGHGAAAIRAGGQAGR